MRYIELRRHTDNEGDQLTAAGIEAATRLGRESLVPPYDLFVSTASSRTTGGSPSSR